MILASHESMIDTVWRSTPLELWMDIVGEVVGGFQIQPPDQLADDFEVGANQYEFEEGKTGRFTRSTTK